MRLCLIVGGWRGIGGCEVLYSGFGWLEIELGIGTIMMGGRWLKFGLSCGGWI